MRKPTRPKGKNTPFENEFIQELSTYCEKKQTTINLLFKRIGYTNQEHIADFVNDRGKYITSRVIGRLKEYMKANP